MGTMVMVRWHRNASRALSRCLDTAQTQADFAHLKLNVYFYNGTSKKAYGSLRIPLSKVPQLAPGAKPPPPVWHPVKEGTTVSGDEYAECPNGVSAIQLQVSSLPPP